LAPDDDEGCHFGHKEYIEQIAKQYYSDIKICKTLEIPTQKDGSEYLLKDLSEQQQAVVLASIDTLVKFLNNNTKYKPLQIYSISVPLWSPVPLWYHFL